MPLIEMARTHPENAYKESIPKVRILCYGVKTLGNCFTLHCSSSLSCINEYLAVDSDGYVYKQPFCVNCSIWLDTPRVVERVLD